MPPAGPAEKQMLCTLAHMLHVSASHTIRRTCRREAHARALACGCRLVLRKRPGAAAGIPIDGKTVFTSDHALKMEWLPNWVAIIGSGYIGLEFSDVYTALGTEVGERG